VFSPVSIDRTVNFDFLTVIIVSAAAGLNADFLNCSSYRNLEYMALARKRKGWVFQYPKRNYYHR